MSPNYHEGIYHATSEVSVGQYKSSLESISEYSTEIG